MGIRKEAFVDLMDRYKEVFRDAWQRRHEMAPMIRKSHEAEFLPATLALQDTPVHPAPRLFMWLILSFALLVLLWAIFGRIDVVATATGKVVPDSRSKVIQPIEVSAVSAIHVRDGQAVKAGDVLIELDAAVAQADIDRLTNEGLAADMDVVRYRALLTAQDQLLSAKKQTSATPVLEHLPSTIDSVRLQEQQRWASGEFEAYSTRLAQLAASINRREADQRATQSLLEKHRETIPITRQREIDYRDLLDKKFIAKHEYLELKTKLIEQERDLIAQQERLAEISASRIEAERELLQFVAERRREWLDKLHDAEQRASSLSQELVKAQTRGRFMRLTAPVDGVIQQLAVHTLNGVVTPAQALMVVVPEEGPIEVEAYLPNKDIGFVHAGQKVEVKLETFSFTKYGTIDGEVISISSDAIQDEKLGLVFSVRVRLDKDHLWVDGNRVNLSPGMAATVEVKTKERRVIEYFFDPLIRHTSESFRER